MNSLTIAAAGPDRSFSLFDWIQSKRRNRLASDKMAKIAPIKQFRHAAKYCTEPSLLGKRKNRPVTSVVECENGNSVVEATSVWEDEHAVIE